MDGLPRRAVGSGIEMGAPLPLLTFSIALGGFSPLIISLNVV